MAKIIDTHTHVYPDAIASRAVVGIAGFYDCPIAYDGRVETLLNAGEAAGIDFHIISSVATTPHQVASINGFIADTVKQHPDTIAGLGTMHPDSGDLAADIANMEELGLLGVKIHPDIQKVAIDDPRYLRLFERCEGKMPVLCHLGDARYDYSNPNRVAKVLERFPKLQMIGAHFGGWSIWREASMTLCHFPNIMVDCSSALFAFSPEEAAELIRLYGADRVLFGTDYPMWNSRQELDRFMAIPLSEEEREKILHQNAEALYGIPG